MMLKVVCWLQVLVSGGLDEKVLTDPEPREMEIVCQGSVSLMTPVRNTFSPASEVETVEQSEETCDFSLLPDDRIAPAESVKVPCTAHETTPLVPDLLKHTSKDSTDGSPQAPDQPTNIAHNDTVMSVVSSKGCEHQTAEKELKSDEIPYPEEKSALRYEETSGSMYHEGFGSTDGKDSSPEEDCSHPPSLDTGDSGLSIDITLEESLTDVLLTSCDSLSISSQTSSEGRRVTPDLIKTTSGSVRQQRVDTGMFSNMDPVVIQEPIQKTDPTLCASVTYHQTPKATEEYEEPKEIEISQTVEEVIFHAKMSELTPNVDEKPENQLLALTLIGSDVREDKQMISQSRIHLDSNQGHFDMIKIAEASSELTCEFAESSHHLSSAVVSYVDNRICVGETYVCQTSANVTQSWMPCETMTCTTDDIYVYNSDVTSQTPPVVALPECFDFKVVATDFITKNETETVEGAYNDSIKTVHIQAEETVDSPTLIISSHDLRSRITGLHSQEEDVSGITEPASEPSHPISQNIPPLVASDNLKPADLEISSQQLLTTSDEWSMAVPPVCLEEEPADISKYSHEKSNTVHTEQLWDEEADCANEETVLTNVAKEQDMFLHPEVPYTAHEFCDAVDEISNGQVLQCPEDSDPEMYFDCKQTVSDYSETETDEVKKLQFYPKDDCLLGVKMRQKSSSTAMLQKQHRRSLRSSGSEDYEDAVFTHERRVEQKRVLEERPMRRGRAAAPLNTRRVYRKVHRELLCQGAKKFLANGDCLKREVAKELGVLSDSSEEDVLTTRVVQRRVIIQADEFPDLSPETTSEEQYVDEQGNMVVKKVSRRIIRRCISDGVEREEVKVEGAPQGSVSVGEGDGYSKVIKRTVLRSEGDQTEVTFCEMPRAPASASGAECEEGEEVSQLVETSLVQGERMEIHHGDPTLASDLPSAQEDFSQVSDA